MATAEQEPGAEVLASARNLDTSQTPEQAVESTDADDVDAEALDLAPFSYENWHAQIAGSSAHVWYETPLFTDAHIIGAVEEGLGPYQLLNAVPRETMRHTRPTIVLRVREYERPQIDLLQLKRTNDDRYHGGELADELAALVSLHLGIRLKAGAMTRVCWGGGADPLGRPAAWLDEADPLLPHIHRSPIVPRALDQHSLDDLELLPHFFVVAPARAVALVRAARLYQEGLWIAESAPELSWLMFVAAVETAAFSWRAGKESPVERLRAERRDVVKKLETAGGPALAEWVARRIAPFIGSTKKFVDFLLEHLPDAPQPRPPEFFAHPWTRNALERSLEIIYDRRSRALHGGKPFPPPMCAAPGHHGDAGEGWDETYGAPAMATRGSAWLKEDTPMLLSTFEYIARHALLTWWRSLPTE